MALRSLRLTSYLRRATKFSSSVLRHNPLIQPEPDSFRSSAIISPSFSSRINRPFTSTTSLFRKIFDPDTDEIGPDTILFEGCDYNHWLITMDFPKDNPPTREQMIETYVNTAAQVFGSVEEAKKKIYALSTTTYQGFQVECSEETSNKFQQLPGVVFVLPDSYIDPVNKEYGGDKYVNGEIFPRPPPVHYGRRTDRRRERNYGPAQQNYPYQSTQQNHSSQQQHYESQPPQQQNPPQQANYRPPVQQGYSPTPQQNYAPSQQQSYTSHQPQNFSPPQQHYGAAQQPTYGQPPPKNYGSPPQWNYNPSQPPRPNYGAHPQPTYGGHQQQNYPPQAQQGYGFPPQQHGHVPPQQPSYEPPNQSYRPSVERNQDPPQVPHAQGSESEGFKRGGN